MTFTFKPKSLFRFFLVDIPRKIELHKIKKNVRKWLQQNQPGTLVQYRSDVLLVLAYEKLPKRSGFGITEEFTRFGLVMWNSNLQSIEQVELVEILEGKGIIPSWTGEFRAKFVSSVACKCVNAHGEKFRTHMLG